MSIWSFISFKKATFWIAGAVLEVMYLKLQANEYF